MNETIEKITSVEIHQDGEVTLDDLTPEQYRAELLEEKASLNRRLTMIKAEIASAIASKEHGKVSHLHLERAEVIDEIADVEAELRQLKQELPHRTTGLQDLHLIVQLVAAEISNSGLCNVDEAIARLNRIKEKLSAQ